MEAVGLQAKAPDVLGMMSQILGVRQQQQALQGGAAQVKSAEQSQRQREALAAHDFNKYVGEDGTLDLNQVIADPELRAAAGDQFLDVLSEAAQAKQGQLATKQALQTLRSDQTASMGQLIGSLRGDPDVAADNDIGRRKVNDLLVQFGETYGPDSYQVLKSTADRVQNTPKGRMGDLLASLQRQAMDASGQRQAVLPQLANTGRALVNVNPDVMPGAVDRLNLSLPPSAQIVADAAGRQFVLDPATNKPVPVGGSAQVSPSASPASTFQQPEYQGQAADVQANQEQVRNIRDAADQAPMQRNVFRNILKLTETTSTGPLVKFLQDTKIGGQAFGDDYQQLAKYLERNAISAMQTMGGPASDDRLAAATAATGSTGFNREALREVTQFNYAANTGLEMYRKGLDKAIGTTNPDYLKLPEFKAAWAENFDIDVFELENAIRDGDTAARDKILDGMSQDKARELMEKRKNLKSLSDNGRLP